MTPHYASDSFYLPKALGDRLRELRKRAGLTQQQLASLMGREFRGNQGLVSRLERGGKYRSPSLRTVADYLRACGASFHDLADILDEYTSRPSVREQQGRKVVKRFVKKLAAKTQRRVNAYDIKTSAKRRFAHEQALAPETRLDRAQRYAAAMAEHDRVSEVLRGLWPRLESPATLLFRQAASNYAHRLWAVLDRTRGRSTSLRARRVADLFVTALHDRELPEKDLKLIHDAVRDLFQRQEQTGAVTVRPPRRSPPRLRIPERLRLPAQLRANETAVVMGKLEVNRVLESEQADEQVRARWQKWLDGLVEIGLHTRAGAERRDACVRRLTRSAPDPTRVSDLAALFFATLDRFLHRT